MLAYLPELLFLRMNETMNVKECAHTQILNKCGTLFYSVSPSFFNAFLISLDCPILTGLWNREYLKPDFILEKRGGGGESNVIFILVHAIIVPEPRLHKKQENILLFPFV